MPWTRSDFPAAMKNLAPMVRNKAIEIANALLEKTKLSTGIIIATSISKAKKWAQNNKWIVKKTDNNSQTEIKKQ